MTIVVLLLSGAVVSGAVALVGSDLFPALSVNVASIFSPSTCGGTKSTSNLPFLSTTPSPITLPLGSVISTLVPDSPLPVTVLPSVLIITSTGASGAVMSGAVALVGSDLFPALSVNVASIFSPSTCGGTKSTSNLPFLSTTPSPITLPLGSVISTLVPDSPLPVTVLPSVLMITSVGASGAIVSTGG